MDIYEKHMERFPELDRSVYTREYYDVLIANSWGGIDYRIPTVAPKLGKLYRTRRLQIVGPMIASTSSDYPFTAPEWGLGWMANGQYHHEDLNPHDLIEELDL